MEGYFGGSEGRGQWQEPAELAPALALAGPGPRPPVPVTAACQGGT